VLRKAILFQALLVALGTVVCLYASQEPTAAYSFALGGAVILVTIGTHFWAWHQIIILQELIGLAVAGIVFKYGILGFILFKATNDWPVHQLFFMYGLLTLLVSLGYLAYLSIAEQR